MNCDENRCVLWVADKHSGKTTTATKLTKYLQQQGCTVGGILAPSVYKNGQLIGFDMIDIQNDVRVPLAVCDEKVCDIVPYRYYEEGLKLGHSALSPANNKTVDLVVVDEYGPLELSGKGWRSDVDNLLRGNYLPVLLVVRRDIADKVKRLYEKYISYSLEALDPESIYKMLDFVLK